MCCHIKKETNKHWEDKGEAIWTPTPHVYNVDKSKLTPMFIFIYVLPPPAIIFRSASPLPTTFSAIALIEIPYFFVDVFNDLSRSCSKAPVVPKEGQIVVFSKNSLP